MKSIIKTLLLFLVIFSAITVRGEATEVLPSNVKLEGNSDGIVFISGDEPFLYKENMLPGDTVSRKMILKNNYTDSYFVYLKGERISKEEPYDLLDKIYVNITYENKSIYNGKILGKNKESREIPLGLIKPGEEKQLTATATL
ncbi:MAG: LPXTG cell wall anchor domain-containing protein, partial [Clostridium baratii]|nr:LPXTG cell wall anchor domain-containing protein [Clostridium baratii]